jgi:hypothetical protein
MPQTLDPDDPLVRWAVLGRQVELLLGSDIGSQIVKRAKTEYDEAMGQLLESDAFDGKTIAALQLKARVASSVLDWFADLIHSGETATEQLKHEQEEGT